MDDNPKHKENSILPTEKTPQQEVVVTGNKDEGSHEDPPPSKWQICINIKERWKSFQSLSTVDIKTFFKSIGKNVGLGYKNYGKGIVNAIAVFSFIVSIFGWCVSRKGYKETVIVKEMIQGQPVMIGSGSVHQYIKEYFRGNLENKHRFIPAPSIVALPFLQQEINENNSNWVVLSSIQGKRELFGESHYKKVGRFIKEIGRVVEVRIGKDPLRVIMSDSLFNHYRLKNDGHISRDKLRSIIEDSLNNNTTIFTTSDNSGTKERFKELIKYNADSSEAKWDEFDLNTKAKGVNFPDNFIILCSDYYWPKDFNYKRCGVKDSVSAEFDCKDLYVYLTANYAQRDDTIVDIDSLIIKFIQNIAPNSIDHIPSKIKINDGDTRILIQQWIINDDGKLEHIKKDE